MAILSRFDRDYELTVQVSANRAVVIKPPLRISFSADKSISGGLNKLSVKIYNLKESNRLALVKDQEQIKAIPISFKVGYKGGLQLIFKGTVHKGQNSREGADLVTELECLDGGFDFLNSFTSKTVKGKTKVIDSVLEDMPNTGRGKITSLDNVTRPKVLVGASAKLIDEIVGENETWYIEDEKLFIIKNDEVVSSFIPVINAATGLINTPSREQSKTTFDTLMNPTIKIGGLAKLESKTAPHLNGVYKAETINYKGDTHGKEWMQSITALLAGAYKVL